ncbi:MAG: hypothetical protein HN496_01470, partial [Flavobacteriaceae bacterium]|nr:hypothetical protein [Flavobacteriaceae bacterium]
MIKKLILLSISFLLVNCSNEIKENTFTISTWTGAGNEFVQKKWENKINYYDSLGIT